MISYVKRLAGPFVEVGATRLPFGFLIFEPSDVFVAVATNEVEVPTNLNFGVDYKVEMNKDQNAVPGGTVVLTAPIKEGRIVVIGSAVDYTQEMQLSNYTRFPPDVINTAMDRIVVQIQQLVERQDRTLTLPATSSATPAEFLSSLFAASDEAIKKAGEAGHFAGAAADSAREAGDYAARAKEHLDNTAVEGRKQIAAIDKKADDEVLRIGNQAELRISQVTQAGSDQVGRVRLEGEAHTRASADEADRSAKAAHDANISAGKADAAAGVAVDAGVIAQKMAGDAQEARDQAQGVSLPLMAQIVHMSDELHRCITDVAQLSLARGQVFDARDRAVSAKEEAVRAETASLAYANDSHAQSAMADSRATDAGRSELVASQKAEEAKQSQVEAKKSEGIAVDAANVAQGVSVPLMAQVVSLADDIHAVDSHEQATSLRVAKLEEASK